MGTLAFESKANIILRDELYPSPVTLLVEHCMSCSPATIDLNHSAGLAPGSNMRAPSLNACTQTSWLCVAIHSRWGFINLSHSADLAYSKTTTGIQASVHGAFALQAPLHQLGLKLTWHIASPGIPGIQASVPGVDPPNEPLVGS
jgi:hypothetical protein